MEGGHGTADSTVAGGRRWRAVTDEDECVAGDRGNGRTWQEGRRIVRV